jgi:hypothetical protein
MVMTDSGGGASSIADEASTCAGDAQSRLTVVCSSAVWRVRDVDAAGSPTCTHR